MESSKQVHAGWCPWRSCTPTVQLAVPCRGIHVHLFSAVSECCCNTAPSPLAVVIGATNVLSTLIGMLFVDKWGRRPLLLQGGVQMMLSQVRLGP